MRVLLVDDHPVVRQTLRMLLEREHDIEVVGEASNGRQGVELTRQLRPDVVLMDLRMPEMDGIAATRILHAEIPDLCVIGLSMFDHDKEAEAMGDAGAMDYVSKSITTDQLLAVLRGCYAHRQEPMPPDG